MSLGIRRAQLDSLLLPGRVADYVNLPISLPEHQQLAQDPLVMEAASADPAPIPTAEAREGYFGDNHFDFWLSGRHTVSQIVGTLPGFPFDTARILDFGGASGRVIRHFASMFPQSRCYLSDINPDHVQLVTKHLPNVTAFGNSHIPTLPFASGELDLIYAMSVFTHIDDLELTWLLELRRCIRSGGALYVTIHNSDTWRILQDTYVWTVARTTEGFEELYASMPLLNERIAVHYNAAEAYNCNIFHPDEYIHSVWARHFSSVKIFPLAHQYQTGVLLIK